MDRICFVLYVLTIFFRHQLSLGMLVPILLVQPFLIWLSYGYLKQQTNHLDYLQYCMDQSLQLDKKVSELIQTQGNEYTRQGLQMQAKLNMETGKDLSHLSGMTYLNALLFDRYRSILTKNCSSAWGVFWRLSSFLKESVGFQKRI